MSYPYLYPRTLALIFFLSLYYAPFCQQVTNTGSNCPGNAAGFELEVFQPQCKLNNGRIVVNVVTNPAVPPITYQWSTGEVMVGWAGLGINNLAPGNYSVTGTDFRSCSVSYNISVEADTANFAFNYDPVSPTCAANSGSIDIYQIFDQFGPFTYQWSNGQQDYKDTLLYPGTYSVTVTDSPGCHAYQTFTLHQYNEQLVWDYNEIHEEYCHAKNGSVTMGILLTGTTPVSFEWSNGVNTQYFDSNLVAGTYYATETDANGCVTVDTFIIQESADSLGAYVTTDSTGCVNMGAAFANFNNFYTLAYFEWSNGSTAYDIYNLPEGYYSFTVADVVGCVETAQGYVAQAQDGPIHPNVDVTTANCTSGGSATCNTTGGTPSYNYRWSDGSYYNSISYVPGGRYLVTISDYWGCTTDTSIQIPDTGTILRVYCLSFPSHCMPDGAAQAIASGGTPPYTYLWSNGQTTDTIGMLGAGSYQVVVTDSLGCKVANYTVVELSNYLDPVQVSLSATKPRCGYPCGTITATASGGTGSYTFDWSNGFTEEGQQSELSQLPPNGYEVLVTDHFGCTATAYILLQDIFPAIRLNIQVTDIVCNKSGSAICTPSGGAPPYYFSWGGGGNSFGNDLSSTDIISTPGEYVAVASDSNGCDANAWFYVYRTDSSLRISASITSDTCLGEKGKVNVTVTGGTPPYSYDWSNGDATNSINHLAAGVYSLSVNDANGCAAATDAIVGQVDIVLGLNFTTQAAICDKDTGSATVHVTGGTPPYAYNWNNGQITAHIVNLAPDAYDITVTDANLCHGYGTAIIADNTSNINPGITTVSASCNQNNGTATSTPVGGVVPYSFNWSNGAVTSTINNLSAGLFTLTVTDDNGCSAEGNAWVGTSSMGDSVRVHAPLCTASTGSAKVFAFGGATPYSYTWSTGSHADSIGGLSPGKYVVTIADNNGCKIIDTLLIKASPGTLSDSLSVYNTICGSHNGNIIANANGGSFPYHFRWSTNDSVPYLANIQAGHYTVTVTDASGCSVSSAATVSNISRQVLFATGSTNPICAGNNGSASITVTGNALAPIHYHWSTGAVTSAISGLAAGQFQVTVTDTLGCSASASVSLTTVTGNMHVNLNSSNATCSSATGGATVLAAGGTVPYHYRWNTHDSVAHISNLHAGTYTVTATDINGCSVTGSVVVNTSGALILPGFVNHYPVCSDSTGSIATNITGGSAPYQYAWANGSTAAVLSNLPSGVYQLTITDASGCTAQASDNLPVNDGAMVAGAATLGANCGQANGSAIAWQVGGHQPFNYVWGTTPTQNGDTATGLAAGNYVVTVTDSKGCTTTGSASVSNTHGPGITLASTPSSGNNGSATVTATGGSGGYTYNWSNGGTSASIGNLSSGTYFVTVTDNNHCEAVGSIQVGSTVGIIVVNGQVQLNLYPNPSSGMIYLDLQLPQTGNVLIEWYDMLGQRLATSQASDVQHLRKEFDMQGYASGTYYVHVVCDEYSITRSVVIQSKGQ